VPSVRQADTSDCQLLKKAPVLLLTETHEGTNCMPEQEGPSLAPCFHRLTWQVVAGN
jgi:hypothetical protein